MAVLAGVLLMAVNRVVDRVHIIEMGMANAFLIEGQDGSHSSTPGTQIRKGPSSPRYATLAVPLISSSI